MRTIPLIIKMLLEDYMKEEGIDDFVILSYWLSGNSYNFLVSYDDWERVVVSIPQSRWYRIFALIKHILGRGT